MSHYTPRNITPLPWYADDTLDIRSRSRDDDFVAFCEDSEEGDNNRRYLVHAANEYPHAIDLIQGIVEQADAQKKVGDEYCTLGTAQVEALRSVLVRAKERELSRCTTSPKSETQSSNAPPSLAMTTMY